MYQRMQALVKDGTLEQTANGINALGRVRSVSNGVIVSSLLPAEQQNSIWRHAVLVVITRLPRKRRRKIAPS